MEPKALTVEELRRIRKQHVNADYLILPPEEARKLFTWIDAKDKRVETLKRALKAWWEWRESNEYPDSPGPLFDRACRLTEEALRKETNDANPE